MGANQSSFQDLAKNYDEIQSVKEKSLTLFKHKSTQELFIVKEKVFTNRSEYDIELKKYTKMQQERDQCENYLKLVRVWTQQHNGFCSNIFKIYPMYEYSSVTLQDEIQARKQQNQWFDQSQILSIMQSCVNAIKSHGQLLITPKSIFIASDGLLKIHNVQLAQQISKSLVTYQQNTYYTPQKMENFSSQQFSGQNEDFIQSQVVFSIGMTILHCMRLQNLFALYNPLNHQKKKRFNKIQLQDILTQLEKQSSIHSKCQQTYSEQLKEILYGMLAPVCQNRISLDQIQRRLYQIYQVQNNASSSKVYANNFKQNYLKKKQSQGVLHLQHNKLLLYQGKSNSNCFDNTQLQILKQINKNNNGNISNYPVSDFDISQKMPSIILSAQNIVSLHHKQNELLSDPAFLQAVRIDMNQIKKHQSMRSSLIGVGVNKEEHKLFNHDVKYKESVATTCKENYQNFEIKGLNINKISFGCQFPLSNSIANLTGACRASQQFTRNSNEISESFPKKFSRNSSNFNQNSKKCVFVKEVYSNGSYYQGMKLQRQNLKHGYGKMVFEDGAFYQGNYKLDKMQGKGVLYYQQNRPAYDGFWSNDQFNGFGVLYNEYPEQMGQLFDYKNLQQIGERWLSYQGLFMNDIKSGNGKITLTNGQCIQGHFEDDRLNGPGEYHLINGTRIAGYWKQNIMIQNHVE